MITFLCVSFAASNFLFTSANRFFDLLLTYFCLRFSWASCYLCLFSSNVETCSWVKISLWSLFLASFNSVIYFSNVLTFFMAFFSLSVELLRRVLDYNTEVVSSFCFSFRESIYAVNCSIERFSFDIFLQLNLWFSSYNRNWPFASFNLSLHSRSDLLESFIFSCFIIYSCFEITFACFTIFPHFV